MDLKLIGLQLATTNLLNLSLRQRP